MAKWGEGDSRWIVEDREDGKNVGAWHWEERNMRDWAEKRLQQMISEGAPRTSAGDCTVVLASLKELKGDCHLHTRKGGKKAAVYELEARFGWSGQAVGEDEAKTLGEIIVTGIDSTNEPDEYEFKVTISNKGQNHDRCEKAAKEFQKEILGYLQLVLEEMIEK